MACNPSRRVLALVIATGLCGCSAGNVARPTVVTFRDNQLFPKDVTVYPASGVPRFVMGRRCPGTELQPDTRRPLYAFRPGVGSRLNLSTWSAGLLQDGKLINRGNTYLPILTPTALSLRLIPDGYPLDQSEEAVLATFLTTNRTEDWTSVVNSDIRKKIEPILESHKAQLWNALVKSICVEASAVKLQGSKDQSALAIQAVSNMTALCAQIPPQFQKDFLKLFVSNLSDYNDKLYPCTNDKNKIVNLPINGEGAETNRLPWSTAVLVLTGTIASDNSYLSSEGWASPNRLFGDVEVHTVRPWGHDVPSWTLQEWEDSGICQFGDQRATIESLKLHGGNRWLRVVADSARPSHQVVVEGGHRRLRRLLDSNPFAFRITKNELRRLTASDVVGLQWKTGLNNPQVSGCNRR